MVESRQLQLDAQNTQENGVGSVTVPTASDSSRARGHGEQGGSFRHQRQESHLIDIVTSNNLSKCNMSIDEIASILGFGTDGIESQILKGRIKRSKGGLSARTARRVKLQNSSNQGAQGTAKEESSNHEKTHMRINEPQDVSARICIYENGVIENEVAEEDLPSQDNRDGIHNHNFVYGKIKD